MKEISLEILKRNLYLDEEQENYNLEYTKYRKENPDISKKILLRGNRKDILSEFFNQGNINGHIISYPHGRVIRYGMKNYYFRGENALYKKSNSSLNRVLNQNNCNNIELEKFKISLKVIHFSKELDKLKQVQEWSIFGDVFGYAIAQHYGLATNLIDITDRLAVALFFATCIYDQKLEKYRPLCEEDIRKEPYGYLYIKKNIDFLELDKLKIYPIGYQPFTRCHKQKGYFIVDTLDKNYDIQSEGFEKLKFKHSVEFSKEIFSKFKSGDELFNYENSKVIKNLLKRIDNSKEFSIKNFKEAFENYKEGLSGNLSEEEIKNLLVENKINLVDEKNFLSKDEIENLDKKWNLENLLKEEELFIGSSKIISR